MRVSFFDEGGIHEPCTASRVYDSFVWLCGGPVSRALHQPRNGVRRGKRPSLRWPRASQAQENLDSRRAHNGSREKDMSEHTRSMPLPRIVVAVGTQAEVL